MKAGSNCLLGVSVLIVTLLTCLYLNYLRFLIPASQNMEIVRTDTPLEGGTIKSTFLKNGNPLTYIDAIKLLAVGDNNFVGLLNTAIAQHPSNAVFWECSSFTLGSIEQIPFEFVLIPSTDLDSIITDISSFRSHFAAHRNSIAGPSEPNEVTTFKSLGGDATLVVPCPSDLENLIYNPAEMAHLALFIRHAVPEHRRELWRTVGSTVLEILEDSALHQRYWLSTSGLGVSWLHVRIDTVPKYYHWAEYKTAKKEVL